MSVRKILGRRVMLVAVILAAMVVATTAQSQAQSQEFNSRTIATYTRRRPSRARLFMRRAARVAMGRRLAAQFASALNGMTFSRNWGGKSAVELFTYINTKMRPRARDNWVPGLRACHCLRAPSEWIQAGQSELPTETMRLRRCNSRGRTQRAGMMMPLSPLAPPMKPVVLPNPLEKFTPVTDELLQNPPPGDWLLWRRTYDDQGFSPLKEITKKNVHDLRVKWAWSLPNGENGGRRWSMTGCSSSRATETTCRR